MINMDGFFDYFVGNAFPITLIILVMVVCFVFIVLMLYVPTLLKRIFPQFGYAKYANYLPFAQVNNDNTMTLTDGSVIRLIVSQVFRQVCKMTKPRQSSWICGRNCLIKFVTLM